MNRPPLMLDIGRYLISTVLKLPISQSSPWFSARAKPNPTARNIRVSVTIRVNTKLTAHMSNLKHGTQWKCGQQESMGFKDFSVCHKNI